MEESEIQQLCRTIYERHRKALDTLFEQRPDRASEVKTVLLEVLGTYPQLVPDHSTKSYVRFIPRTLDFFPKIGDGWTPTKRLVLCELGNFPSGLSLAIILGPGERAVRERIHQTVQAHAKVFNRATQPLSPKWWSFHTEKWIGPKQYEELDVDGLKEEFKQHFDRFIKERLPAIEGALESLSTEPRL